MCRRNREEEKKNTANRTFRTIYERVSRVKTLFFVFFVFGLVYFTSTKNICYGPVLTRTRRRATKMCVSFFFLFCPNRNHLRRKFEISKKNVISIRKNEISYSSCYTLFEYDTPWMRALRSIRLHARAYVDQQVLFAMSWCRKIFGTQKRKTFARPIKRTRNGR